MNLNILVLDVNIGCLSWKSSTDSLISSSLLCYQVLRFKFYNISHNSLFTR